MVIKSDLIRYARSLGFERIGVTSAAPLEREEAFFKEWLAEGRAGEMDYLERKAELRSRPVELLSGAKSVISMAMNYDAPSSGPRRADEGKIARYAWGKDYHKVLKKRLDSFVRYVEALAPDAECRTFVDTGPLLERALAQRAGLGFIGKNTMLITKGLGSWVFLASVITTLDLPKDSPDERSCGECRLCIDACPTDAITEPFKLDARRCIAYLTIESDKEAPLELRAKMGEWVFGCDICQEVCPHNTIPSSRLARPSPERGEGFKSPSPFSGEGWGEGLPRLSEILFLADEAEFQKRFIGTPFIRAGRAGLLRNACVAAANLGRKDLIPRLQSLAETDSSPIVRGHAAWAVETLGARRAPTVP